MNEIMKVLESVKNGISAIAYLSNEKRNEILDICGESLTSEMAEILKANIVDVETAKNSGKPQSFIDRLSLDENRIQTMVEGLKQLKNIMSPVGEEISSWSTESQLEIRKITVPLGVFCIIFEARPNVVADTVGLAIKSGNGIVLRGSKDAINSNIAIVKAIKNGIEKAGINSDFIGLIEDTTHEGVNFLMKQRDKIDVIIPRGGSGLIKNVVENSLIPTIETGLGNCHIYINKDCDRDLAKKITTSGKISRVSVCNSLESLVIDREISDELLPILLEDLIANGVEIRGDKEVKSLCKTAKIATHEDYFREYNDYIMSVKIVENLDKAIEWINNHSTHHSESIISNNKTAVEKFNERIDSACVFHNTSTRFSDGFQFGFGAEVGISTQKLHARGPMGVRELTTYKYAITSKGEVR